MSSSTIYLISGSNRGIGLGLVDYILTENRTAFVYAGARNPKTASSLVDLKKRYPDRISIVKCVSADIEGNAALAKEIEDHHGRLDTVIANAAIGGLYDSVANVDVESLENHFHVNVTGTVVLFQAVYGLLKKSSNPRFIPISSSAGRISDGLVTSPEQMGGVSYGSSKAALNWVSRKIHFENEWLVTFPMNPGVVETDMLQNTRDADPTGLFKGTHAKENASPESAAAAMVKIIDSSTREEEGGQFLEVDGTRLTW